MPQETIWNLTAEEISAVLDRERHMEKQATLRAGIVAATVQNAHRVDTRGRRLFFGRRAAKPTDFLPQKRRHMTPDEAVQFMDRWADQRNKAAEA